MPSHNHVTLLGNIGQDPELNYTSTGKEVCTLSVATNEQFGERDEDGRRQERTSWHRVVCWGALAANCCEHLKKGRQVMVEGRLQYRDYLNKQGDTVKGQAEIVATKVIFCGPSTKRQTAE